MQERKKQIEELEYDLATLIERRKDLQKQIDKLRDRINSLKVYDRYYKSVVDHNKDKSGSTCQEILGKKHKDLNKEEMREYHKIKQAERRKRVKMDSPSTAKITRYNDCFRQERNDETKAKAKRELILAWNRRKDNEQREAD